MFDIERTGGIKYVCKISVIAYNIVGRKIFLFSINFFAKNGTKVLTFSGLSYII